MQNNFINIQFPIDISYGSSGGPLYDSEILTTISGGEIRNLNTPRAKMYFDVSPGIKNKKQIDKILAFFRICHGRQKGFRLKDWVDFQGIKEKVIIIDKKTIQLIKTYKFNDDIYEERLISKPVPGTVTIYINKRRISNQDLEINHSNGRVKFKNYTTKSTDIITASFEFDVPVRFDLDYLPIIIESCDVFALPEIPLIEI